MIKERKEIDKKYKWDLSVIYKDDAAFEADYAVAAEKVEALKQTADLTQQKDSLITIQIIFLLLLKNCVHAYCTPISD